jgi:hypothetical protein
MFLKFLPRPQSSRKGTWKSLQEVGPFPAETPVVSPDISLYPT